MTCTYPPVHGGVPSSAGVIDCILGAVLMEALQHMQLLAWLVPIVAPVALMFIAGISLEYRRRKVSLRARAYIGIAYMLCVAV